MTLVKKNGRWMSDSWVSDAHLLEPDIPNGFLIGIRHITVSFKMRGRFRVTKIKHPYPEQRVPEEYAQKVCQLLTDLCHNEVDVSL